MSCPKLSVVATGDLPPRLAQVCHHSMRQNSVSCGRMLGNTYRATAARAKNTIGFHIPNMFCGDQRQMVSAQPSEPFPKPESPCLLVLGRYFRNILSWSSLSYLLGNCWRWWGLSPAPLISGTTLCMSREVAACIHGPWNVRNSSSCVYKQAQKQTAGYPNGCNKKGSDAWQEKERKFGPLGKAAAPH